MDNQPPLWSVRYVGVPFLDLGRDLRGCDCWGLVRLVMKEMGQVTLPCLATGYGSEADHRKVFDEIERERSSQEWVEIPRGEEKAFDVAEMTCPTRYDGRWDFAPLHVGIVVSPGWMLHTERATMSRLMRCNDPKMAKRIIGFWRNRQLIRDAT
jgi:cell wall-associated NlpC family hydrolase